MDGKVIEIYEKYANLFKIRITGPVETIHRLAVTQEQHYPKLPATRTGQNSPIERSEPAQQKALHPRDVKDLLRNLFCQKVSQVPNLDINDFGTKIINRKTLLGTYGGKVAIVRPGSDFRIVNVGEDYYLCLDYAVAVRNHLNAAEIMDLLPTFSFNLEKGFYREGGEWKEGQIEEVQGHVASIQTPEGIAKVPSNCFVPNMAYSELSQILEKKGLKADFDRSIKKLGLLTVDKPPRQRMEAITRFAVHLKETVFPIKVGDYEIDIDPHPVRLLSPSFDVRTDIEEPFSAFDHEDETKRSQQILEGLTRHGSYEKPKTEINAVILATKDKASGYRPVHRPAYQRRRSVPRHGQNIWRKPQNNGYDIDGQYLGICRGV